MGRRKGERDCFVYPGGGRGTPNQWEVEITTPPPLFLEGWKKKE